MIFQKVELYNPPPHKSTWQSGEDGGFDTKTRFEKWSTLHSAIWNKISFKNWNFHNKKQNIIKTDKKVLFDKFQNFYDLWVEKYRRQINFISDFFYFLSSIKWIELSRIEQLLFVTLYQRSILFLPQPKWNQQQWVVSISFFILSN